MMTVFISTLRRPFVCCFCPGVREIKDFIVFVDIPLCSVRYLPSSTYNGSE